MNPPIIAISSPPGPSRRGIVRVSGADLGPFVDSVLDRSPTDRELTPAYLAVDRARPAIRLPVLAMFCRAPHTFTGEDTLELQLPGNPALLERILHGLLDRLREIDDRARLAEPGEFTHRAFAAGRIDLLRAEGIAATIGATSDAQLRAATQFRTGELGRWSTALVDSLSQTLALVEAGIDFVDQDDVVPITPGDLDARLVSIETELRGMLSRSRSWSSLEALPWVVLVGPPNAGKSTLMNALLGRERAVTSDIAGTTRDVIAEPMKLEGAGEVMLVDIAGLDEARGLIDVSMQAAAREAIERADLVIRVHAPNTAAPSTEPPEGTPVLDAYSKSDLRDSGSRLAAPGIAVSAVTGDGLDTLRGAIAEVLRDRTVSLGGEMFALRPRHCAELDIALGGVVEARTIIEPQRGEPALSETELIASHLRAALDALGALGGAMSPDDVIGKVFATFCVGK